MGQPRTGSVLFNVKRDTWVARLDWVDETGKRHCRKKDVENKSTGQRIVKRWIRDLEDYGKTYLDADRMTFDKLAKDFEGERLIEPIYKDGRKVAGLRDYEGQQRRLKALVKYFGRTPVKKITAADIDKYRVARLREPTALTRRPRTLADVNRSLSLLRTIFNYAVHAGWLSRNPFSLKTGIISLAQETVRERVLTIDEQRRLLAACREPVRGHIFPLVLTALDSGCRRGELLKLKWESVDLERGLLTVIAENAKTNRARLIDLDAVTVGELRRLKEITLGKPDQLVFGLKSSFFHAWSSALKAAELEGLRFHDLRACAIVGWLLRGMRSEFAMLRSGHANPMIFQRYVRMSDQLREQARAQMKDWEIAESFSSLTSGDVKGFVN